MRKEHMVEKIERVQKIIANAGLTSRRKAEDLIAAGKVRVNNKVITLGDKADARVDKITVEGTKLKIAQKIYLMFHKPIDCLTTLSDPLGRKTIFDYIKFQERLIPCGRLDYKTEGLLLVTNDGDWANKIMHPRYEVEKTYLVKVDKEFSKEDMERVKTGIRLDDLDVTTAPAKIRYAGDDKRVIEVRIHEGMNRIVRRMMQELGYRVARLARVKIGKLELGELKMGKWRTLRRNEVEFFK